MTKTYQIATVFASCVMAGISATAQAANAGNVTVSGTGSCTIPQNISPILVTTYQQTINGVVNTV